MRAYNQERLGHTQAGLTYLDYLGTADFWERTLQNWQSEFLGRGLDGDPRRIPAPEGLARVKASRRSPRRDRYHGLNDRLRGSGQLLRVA